MSLRIAQESHYRGNDWWEWSVWTEGTEAELNNIDSVTYFLHPTFPDPVRVNVDRASKFRLDSAGWGEFALKVKIQQKDGTTRTRTHRLKLEYPDEEETKDTRDSVVFMSSSAADGAVAKALRAALEERNIKVVGGEGLPVGVPWEVSLKTSVSESDAVIPIISDATSPWVGQELEMARRLRVPIIPVAFGSAPLVPESLRDVHTVHIMDLEDTPEAVEELAATVKRQRRRKRQ